MKRFTLLPRKRHRQRGQVMLVAVTIMIILLVIGLFVFDLSNMVRLRAKTQTGCDSASIAGAAWQGRALNMIGEINLIKASTVLVSDVPPFGDDSSTGLLESSAAMSQMQARISYAGPLLGMSAMQQAAKANGIRDDSGIYTQHLQHHIDNFVTSGVYEELFPSEIEGYEWLAPYGAMLQQVADAGLAAQTLNSRYLNGMPQLHGPGADLLMDPDFYSAVHSRNFCWFYRRGLGPDDYFDFTQITYESGVASYFPGSEFLPIFIDFNTLSAVPDVQVYQQANGYTPHAADQAGVDELRWATYFSGGNGWDSTGRYDFINNYMRTSIKDEYIYGGAGLRVLCSSSPSLIAGIWDWEYGQTEDEVDDTDLGDAISWSQAPVDGDNTYTSAGQRLSAAESSVAGLRERESVESVAGAKPFGKLEDGVPPQDAGIVLPVFDAVRLIPAALLPENVSERNPFFHMFLIEYFGHPSYPNVPQSIVDRYFYYVSAMRQFSDRNSDFREQWREFDIWRDQQMAGPDLILNSGDDERDPCLPRPGGGGGGGGGGGSSGGPSILH
jgi:hypothetical protein